MNLESSAIRRVTHYVATPVETCDRCYAGIKYVFMVTYKDGETLKYGSECINKILNNEPKLKTLFQSNAKKLAKFQDYYNILSGPIEAMPQGQEYYGSGMRLVADSTGKDIAFGHYYFHPIFDIEKNQNGKNYVIKDADKTFAESIQAIETMKNALKPEIERLEMFLAKVLRASAKQQASD